MRYWPVGGILLFCALSLPAQGQWVERTYQVEAGWNAVFLDVEPYPSACSDLLEGLPVESVWSRRDDGSTIKVVGSIPQLLQEEDLWKVYYPEDSPHSQINSLSHLEVGRAFLIQASESFTLTFKGRPRFVDRAWKVGSLNLGGFYVQSGNAASFEDFLSADPSTGIRSAYSLMPTGGWSEIGDLSTSIEPGKAYLVQGEFKRGAGAVHLDVGTGYSFEFPRGTNTQTINLSCETGESSTVQIALSDSESIPDGSPSLGQEAPIPIAGSVAARWRLAERPSDPWRPFPASIRMDGEATPEVNVRIAIDRLAMGSGDPGDLNQGILTVTDNSGYSRQFGISGERLDPTGLWVGTVTLDAVSMPFEQGIEQAPEYTPAKTEFRVLVHVDENGDLKLIDEATQMWRPMENHPDGGEFVLLTRSLSEDLRAELSAGLKNGTIDRPLRISTVNFDLRDENNAPVDQPLSGQFIPGATLETTVVLHDENPTNPFHHKYHPDLTWFDNPLPSEIWDVSREISLYLDPAQSSEEAEAGWGDSWLRGTYAERISGIHEYDIQVAGTVYFRHLSRIGALNGE
ncbi:MAG: hypothetical protein H6752_05890 [Candidatus Omnitrophica bacterium]|nr:hypothetical protein [Candidatus Omnitrophota bacterium]